MFKQLQIPIVVAVSLTLLIVVGSISFFHSGTAPLAANHTSSLPDAFMEDVVAMVYDKHGKPKMKIVAPKMEYFANEDKTMLTQPQLTLYRQSPQPWYVTSKTAEATENSEHVFFKDHVTIQHAADHNNPATVIQTETLLVHPNIQIAETKDSITLVQPNMVIKGTGMHADINNGNINLLSEAQGEYVPS